MKHSIFNNVISLSKGKLLLYNSFTDSFLILSSSLNTVFKNKSPKSILKDNPTFYNQLVTTGCFIDNEIDEIKQLSKKIESLCNDDSQYSLIINPTTNCNFKCWYCYEEHIAGVKMSDHILNNVKQYITRITTSSKIKKFHLSFFGGEPLLYFYNIVLPIIEHYNEQCKINNIQTGISFTTNGYLITEKMVKEFSRCKVDSFQITIDGNREQHNKTRFPYKGGESYDRILDNIKMLISRKMTIIMRINYTSDNINSIKDIEQYLVSIPEDQRKYISINFQRVWQDYSEGAKLYGEKDIDNIVQNYINRYSELGILASTVLLDFVNQSCYADKRNEAVINFDGNVFKCTARNFDPSNKIGHLNNNGEIDWMQEKLEKRFQVRYSKPICETCRIAPLCGGTCGQKIIESNDKNICLMGFDEKHKDKAIIDRFYLKHAKHSL